MLPRDLPDGPAILYCDGRAVGPIRVAATRRARYRGLLGEDSIDGALLLLKTNGVHTIGMRFPIDVAYLSRTLKVIDITHLAPNRWSRNRLTARHTLETAEGRLTEWGIERGSQLTVERLYENPADVVEPE